MLAVAAAICPQTFFLDSFHHERRYNFGLAAKHETIIDRLPRFLAARKPLNLPYFFFNFCSFRAAKMHLPRAL